MSAAAIDAVVAPAPILSVDRLRISYRGRQGALRAVDDFGLDLHPGEVIGIIGESGSGKTSAIRALIGLLPANATVDSGTIVFRGETVFGPGADALATIRGGGVGMIFQSASASINPLFRIGTQLEETLRAHGKWSPSSHGDLVRLLAQLGLQEPERVLRSYPYQLSGGMLQRAAIALAVAVSPPVVIADECTSALDVTTQAEVIEVLRALIEGGRGLIYVTHDLLLASKICTSLIVMYAGQIVERGETRRVLEAPRHPYTRALLAAVPAWGPKRALAGIDGLPPHVGAGWKGCVFAPRCASAVAACSQQPIEWTGSNRDGYRCINPVTHSPQA
jgi:oligopeptide/dipeptide ABC transporter ATP-binding protein